MSREELEELVSKIKKEEGVTFTITPRILINALGCERRTSNNQWYVNKFLEENQLEVIPNYVDSWINSEIILKHKERAATKLGKDPIKKIMILESANKPPITINNDAKLEKAVTTMMIHNYTQLPVVSGPKNLVGFISWITIGTAITNGVKSDCVKDYINKNVKVLSPETPLLEAIKTVYENDFVVVQKNDKTISGIVTTADISSQFLTMTEPFLLLEQIENHIRQILHNKFLLEDILKFSNQESGRNINCIDDLNFGEYIRLMENNENWKKLNISIDKELFIKRLDEVRKIRNDIMHFDPEGITETQHNELKNMSQFLYELNKYYK